jgi:hypothetical protein
VRPGSGELLAKKTLSNFGENRRKKQILLKFLVSPAVADFATSRRLEKSGRPQAIFGNNRLTRDWIFQSDASDHSEHGCSEHDFQ